MTARLLTPPDIEQSKPQFSPTIPATTGLQYKVKFIIFIRQDVLNRNNRSSSWATVTEAKISDRHVKDYPDYQDHTPLKLHKASKRARLASMTENSSHYGKPSNSCSPSVWESFRCLLEMALVKDADHKSTSELCGASNEVLCQPSRNAQHHLVSTAFLCIKKELGHWWKSIVRWTW